MELREQLDNNTKNVKQSKDQLIDIQGAMGGLNEMNDTDIKSFKLLQAKRNLGYKYKDAEKMIKALDNKLKELAEKSKLFDRQSQILGMDKYDDYYKDRAAGTEYIGKDAAGGSGKKTPRS